MFDWLRDKKKRRKAIHGVSTIVFLMYLMLFVLCLWISLDMFTLMLPAIEAKNYELINIGFLAGIYFGVLAICFISVAFMLELFDIGFVLRDIRDNTKGDENKNIIELLETIRDMLEVKVREE